LELQTFNRLNSNEIALLPKDWEYTGWLKVVFPNEASILVGEHQGLQNLSQTLNERYYLNVIEGQYNNYLEAMF